MTSGIVHEALLFDSDEAFLASAVPFLRDGMAAGEPCFAAIDPRRRALLQPRVPGPVKWLDPLDPAVPYSAPRTLRGTLEPHLRGERQMRMLSDTPHPGVGASWHGWLRHEAASSDLYDDLPLWLMCSCDAREASNEVLADLLALHAWVATPEGHVANAALEDPARHLARRERGWIDPLEDETPQLELHAPTPRFARDSVEALARVASLPPASVDRLGHAVAEIVLNAIDHGAPPVALRAWAGPDRVAVSVTDHGEGPVDPFAGLRTGADAGLGLHLALQLCSDVAFETRAGSFAVHLVARD